MPGQPVKQFIQETVADRAPSLIINSVGVVYEPARRPVEKLIDGLVKVLVNVPGPVRNTGKAEQARMGQGIDSRGRSLPSGIYICQLRTDYATKSIKMMLLK